RRGQDSGASPEAAQPAPKGRNRAAQGNALGRRTATTHQKPRRGAMGQPRATPWVAGRPNPTQALKGRNKGRPLADCAPLGLGGTRGPAPGELPLAITFRPVGAPGRSASVPSCPFRRGLLLCRTAFPSRPVRSAGFGKPSYNKRSPDPPRPLRPFGADS